MIASTLTSLFKRDLSKLIQELEQYSAESNIWVIEKDILNSAGNLSLHLIGNLNSHIGKELGGSGYQRNRSAEFAAKYVPREELIAQIKDIALIIEQVLSEISPVKLAEAFPLPNEGQIVTTEYFLLHLSTHLNYHLGQINYHRRLLDH